jgi:hypothetical protein
MAPYGRCLPAWRLSGYDLCTLMRRHRVTIRMLAQRLDLPMTRVRYRRRHGIEEWNIIRDWVEAITGVDPGAVPRPVGHGAPATPPR